MTRTHKFIPCQKSLNANKEVFISKSYDPYYIVSGYDHLAWRRSTPMMGLVVSRSRGVIHRNSVLKLSVFHPKVLVRKKIIPIKI